MSWIQSDDEETKAGGTRARSGADSPGTDPARSSSITDRVRGLSMRSSRREGEDRLDRRGRSTDAPRDESGSWFGRARTKYGLGTVLAGVGLVLFLFPEPVTSTAGLFLIGAGVLLWLLN